MTIAVDLERKATKKKKKKTIPNMKAPELMVSGKNIFSYFSLYKPM